MTLAVRMQPFCSGGTSEVVAEVAKEAVPWSATWAAWSASVASFLSRAAMVMSTWIRSDNMLHGMIDLSLPMQQQYDSD
jgi:hypothetical protein